MFAPPKPQKPYTPKPYEQMTYPGQRVQIDVKVVPRRCIADPELRLFRYTAIDEFTRLRFPAAYPEQSTYSSADFLSKLVKWFARRGIQVECCRPTMALSLPTVLPMQSGNCLLCLKPPHNSLAYVISSSDLTRLDTMEKWNEAIARIKNAFIPPIPSVP